MQRLMAAVWQGRVMRQLVVELWGPRAGTGFLVNGGGGLGDSRADACPSFGAIVGSLAGRTRT